MCPIHPVRVPSAADLDSLLSLWQRQPVKIAEERG